MTELLLLFHHFQVALYCRDVFNGCVQTQIQWACICYKISEKDLKKIRENGSTHSSSINVNIHMRGTGDSVVGFSPAMQNAQVRTPATGCSYIYTVTENINLSIWLWIYLFLSCCSLEPITRFLISKLNSFSLHKIPWLWLKIHSPCVQRHKVVVVSGML